jgi:hypothetical protein
MPKPKTRHSWRVFLSRSTSNCTLGYLCDTFFGVRRNQAYVRTANGPEKGTFTCPFCNQPVDLTRDKYADENGKVMHESCYVRRLMSSQNDPPDPHHTE